MRLAQGVLLDKPWPGWCQQCGARMLPGSGTWCYTCGTTDADYDPDEGEASA